MIYFVVRQTIRWFASGFLCVINVIKAPVRSSLWRRQKDDNDSRSLIRFSWNPEAEASGFQKNQRRIFFIRTKHLSPGGDLSDSDRIWKLFFTLLSTGTSPLQTVRKRCAAFMFCMYFSLNSVVFLIRFWYF